MKKKWNVLFPLFMLTLICGFIYASIVDVESLHNELIEITDVALLNMLENGEKDFFIYVGRPTCPFCVEYRPIIEKAITSKHFYFYSFDTDKNRDNDYFSEVIERLTITSIPFLIKVRDGEVVSMHGYLDGNTVEEVQSWITQTQNDL